ncbi:MAG: 4Fe-4S binding protein [bacterium]
MKSRLALNFSTEVAGSPLTFSLVKEFGLSINILKAEIFPGRGGELLIEVEGYENDISEGVGFLENEGVKVEGIEKRIRFRENECVNCGTCTAVCFSNALTIEEPDWKLEFDYTKCIACGLCVKACPLKLFEISFGG